ncbi:MAG TPA: hypothetical protein VH561_03600 [Micromonosporaceae bacterium]|jgi:hypothetical protein
MVAVSTHTRGTSRGRRRVTSVLVAFCATVALTGCQFFPSDPINPPRLAVLLSGGQVQILYVSCTPVQITAIEVLRPADQKGHLVREHEPAVWRATFASPTTATTFIVGQTPSGGTEDVPLAGDLDDQTYYVARVTLAGSGGYSAVGFTLHEMGDQISFGGAYISTQQFDQDRSCPSP